MTKQSTFWLLPIATAIGAWGGFPKPPQFFTDLVEASDLVKYFMVFILIWQGGGNQNFHTSVTITLVVYAITMLAKFKQKYDIVKVENFRQFRHY